MKAQTVRTLFFIFVLVSLQVLGGSIALAEESDSVPSVPAAAPTYGAFKNALGFFGSTVSVSSGSYGLHYQRWFNAFGLQFTAGGTYNPSSAYPLDYSANATLLWSVYGQDFSRWLGGRLYLWGMVGHHGRIDAVIEEPGKSVSSQIFIPTAFVGAGIGIETILFEHFSLPLQFGYSGEFPYMPSVGFSLGGGIRYRY